MNNKKIIDYVMQSPNNTNPAVLESMLEAINSGGGTSDVAQNAYFVCDKEGHTYNNFDSYPVVYDTFLKLDSAVPKLNKGMKLFIVAGLARNTLLFGETQILPLTINEIPTEEIFELSDYFVGITNDVIEDGGTIEKGFYLVLDKFLKTDGNGQRLYDTFLIAFVDA